MLGFRRRVFIYSPPSCRSWLNRRDADMSLDNKLRRRLEQTLGVVDDHDTKGPRLVDDAKRLWSRCRRFIAMRLVAAEADLDALELACYALQLPVRQANPPTSRTFGPTHPNDRDEH